MIKVRAFSFVQKPMGNFTIKNFPAPTALGVTEENGIVCNALGIRYLIKPDVLEEFKSSIEKTLAYYKENGLTIERINKYNAHLQDEHYESFDPVKRPPRLPKKTFIYLIRDEKTGFIKIGESVNPQERLRTLLKQDTYLPEEHKFTLLFSFPGVQADELALHERFEDKRIRGEWFALTQEDTANLATEKMGGGK